jgi:endogenous inhibitor of DNA gyrase (YacG/DUF329 family)
VKRQGPIVTRHAHCPRCAREVVWRGNPHRPFCSLSCRLIDLGMWLDERYQIAGPEFPTEAIGERDDSHDGG